MSEMHRTAQISDCGRYRYRLGRTWDPTLPRRVLFVMLNPSTADAEVDDATIRSCIRLCKSWSYGFGGLWVVNLFAWRATDPRDLEKADSPIGPDNDAVIADAVANSKFTICAWGAHKMANRRADRVLQIVRREKGYAHCLGKTKSGAPRHPLYLKTETEVEIYS